MLHSVRRRISNLEESIPIPISAERFLSRAHEHARRAGVSVQAAIGTLGHDLSDSGLDSLTAEFEQLAFGADTVARDAARHRASMAADQGSPRASGIEKLCSSRVSDLSNLDNPFNCIGSN